MVMLLACMMSTCSRLQREIRSSPNPAAKTAREKSRGIVEARDARLSIPSTDSGILKSCKGMPGSTNRSVNPPKLFRLMYGTIPESGSALKKPESLARTKWPPPISVLM